MTKTFINKLILTIAALAVVFTLVSYFEAVNTSIIVETAHAAGTCGSCGDTGGGGGGGGGDTVTPPTCDIATNLSSVVAGKQYTVTWAVGSATVVNAYVNGEHVNKTGSATYTFEAINTTETFVLTAENAGGTCSDKVVVSKKVVAPACDITASISVAEVGQKYTINWVGTPSDGVFKVNGYTVNAKDYATYTFLESSEKETFTFTGSHDGATCSDTVVITRKPDGSAPSCDSFTGTPSTLPYGGGDVELAWTTSNVDSVSINHGVGTVAEDGSKTVSVSDTITYTLTASKAGFSDATCPVTITVLPEVTELTCAANVTFTANKYSLPRGGGDVTLNWTTVDVDSVSITDVTSTALNGSEVVGVTASKKFVLTATAGDKSVQCPLTISVATGGGGGGSSSPRCDLDISEQKIKKGEEVTLTWDTSRASEVKITDNHGNVLLDSDDNDDFDGEMTIKPTRDTQYTLLSKRGSRDRECEVEVEVEDSVTVFQTRSQDPRVAGISLTQVPYTGFEAGPALTMIFYTLLTLWGLFVAYVLVIRRDSIGGVSLAGSHDHVPFTDMSVEADSTEESSIAEGYVQSAVAENVPANLPTAIAPIVGYAARQMSDEETDASIEMTELENRAHAQKALMSSDSMRFFMNATEESARAETLDSIIAEAKGTFPSENGWVVLNLARLESLMGDAEVANEVAEQTEAITSGSLAEAIVTGNVVAAYQMIASRPMVALADAAADLDAVYRSRKGEEVSVSNMLITAAAALSTQQLEEAIAALTGALDGTYVDEASAVKMAIMKAVKATS